MDEHLASVLEAIGRALDKLHIGSAFGPAVQQEERTIIPIAEVHIALGCSEKEGQGDLGATVVSVLQSSISNIGNVNSSRSVEGGEERGEPQAPSHAVSGGVQGRVVPRGYIEVAPEGTNFIEMVDVTRLGLAGIAFAAWATYYIGRTVQRVARFKAADRR